jgi:hypothetical protein
MTVREGIIAFCLIVFVLFGLTAAGFFNGAWQRDQQSVTTK